MKSLDDVLKKSLTPAESEEGPDFWLNQNILKRADRQERGAKRMKKRTYRPTKAVAALVIALSISGSAVFAAEKTNLFGNLSKSISSNLSHTPSVFITYSFHITFSINFFASYLSTNLVYNSFLS